MSSTVRDAARKLPTPLRLNLAVKSTSASILSRGDDQEAEFAKKDRIGEEEEEHEDISNGDSNYEEDETPVDKKNILVNKNEERCDKKRARKQGSKIEEDRKQIAISEGHEPVIDPIVRYMDLAVDAKTRGMMKLHDKLVAKAARQVDEELPDADRPPDLIKKRQEGMGRVRVRRSSRDSPDEKEEEGEDEQQERKDELVKWIKGYHIVKKVGPDGKEAEWAELDSQPGSLLKIINDPKERQDIIARIHSENNHRSAPTTTSQVINIGNAFWPTIDTDVEEYQKRCTICQTMNPGQRIFAPARSVYPSGPGNHLAMAISGPLPISKDKQAYILVLTCYCSSFIWTYLPTNVSSETVRDILRSHFSKWGYPHMISSDNGSHFRGEVTRLLERYNIQHILSAPDNPRSNGKAKHAIKMIRQGLFKALEEKGLSQQDWPLCLDNVTEGYNRTAQAVLGMSPFEVMFFRKNFVAPSETYAPTAPIDWSEIDIDTVRRIWIGGLQEFHKESIPVINARISKARDRQAAVQDANRRVDPRPLELGTYVRTKLMVRDLTQQHQFWSRMLFRVRSRDSVGNYYLIGQKVNDKGETKDYVPRRAFPRDQLRQVPPPVETLNAV